MKKVRKSDPRNGWYVVTPTDAQNLLDNQVKNRPLSEYYAAGIAGDIKQNQFRENGEPLIFTDLEKMLDGQYRCRASILAKKAFTTYCVFGVPKTAFDTIDRGKKRNASDVLAILGVKHYTVAAAMVRFLLAYNRMKKKDTRLPSRAKITNWEVTDFTRKFSDEVQHAAIAASSGARNLEGLIPPGAVGFVYFMARRTNKAKADAWLRGLVTGTELATGSPVLVVKLKLQALARGKYKADKTDKAALLVKSWLAFRDGRRISNLKFDVREAFPQF